MKITFYLLTAVTLTIIAMLLFMQINDSVKASGGEIISTNPPVEYQAYLEGEVKQVLVNEGAKVKKGDTLIIIQNHSIRSEYTKAKEGYFLEQMNLGLNKKELENLNEKLAGLNKQRNLIYANDKYNRNNISIELSSLEEKINASEEKLKLTESRLEKDKGLYKDGILSQQEFENKRRAYLDELNQLAEIRQQYNLKISSQRGNKNAISGQLQQLNFDWISLEQEIIGLKKQVFQQETLIQNLGVQMDYLSDEMGKLVVVADFDGVVISLFNEKQNTRYVEKGAPLLIVKPLADAMFYARLQIPQSAVAKVRTGQAIHLKLKAYNYYQHGILKGNIKSINPKDSTNQFYVLVEIPEVPEYFELQSGYQVKGDIILARMKLYRYALNGLFGNLG